MWCYFGVDMGKCVTGKCVLGVCFMVVCVVFGWTWPVWCGGSLGGVVFS